MARVLVVDVINKKDVHEAECTELKDFYRELDCDCFDIAYRKVGSKYFDIFVDDNGLFRDMPIPSMFSETLETMLVGNLVFANHDSEGNTTSLSDEDIAMIKKNIVNVGIVGGDVYPAVICMTDCE